ncbi:hypothetical protein JCM3765_002854 [Sporobolomyces pararoseus]
MPCLVRLPVNADTTLVALCRPITFLVALSFSLVAFAYSSFLNLFDLSPLECRCPNADKSPRTRPRPQSLPQSPTPPLSASASPSSKPSPLDSLSSFSSFVAESFRPRRPPPVARRGSHNKTLPYPVHELEEVLEEEDGEGMEFRDREELTDGEEPGLTPDVSEGEETSSLDTMDEVRTESSKKSRTKGLGFLGNLRWKSPSGSQSSSEEPRHPFSSSNTNSDPSHISPPKSAFKSSGPRPRSATSSTTSSRSVHFNPRRQTSLDSVSSSESIETPVGAGTNLLRSRKPLTINTSSSSSSSQPRTLFSKSSFRSISPLSRSPVTTPEPSPPSSPRVGAVSSSNTCLVAKHLATRLSRSHSLDSHASSSRGRRQRSGSPLPEPAAPRLRRGMSGSDSLAIDSTGSSHLKLDDLLR